jgi:hypothetical protein
MIFPFSATSALCSSAQTGSKDVGILAALLHAQCPIDAGELFEASYRRPDNRQSPNMNTAML